MTTTVPGYDDILQGTSALSNQELDEKLERAVIQNEKSEMLVCCYLSEVRERRAYTDFGYTNIYDYAHARFGYGARKTRYLISCGRTRSRFTASVRVRRSPRWRRSS